MLLSKLLCVPTKCNPRRAYSAGDLVYALNHHLNPHWAAAVITKLYGSDICDTRA
ncbi:unnamed protein product [Hymenolepis diminuta]|uniref:Uncharacterized protein n=1 Tax=Hymenolepis diminuta TaxID=6216 RepID=A0A564YEX5_HYMDI|nr:unnamed protein product [Hymenolepis diminuta]